jgi:hypothetical protein
MEERKILFKTYQYCETVPAQSLTLSLPTVEVTFKSYTKNLTTLHLQFEINNAKELCL